MQDFPHMNKKDSEPKSQVRNNNHSFMSSTDRPLSERLTHDKIIKNFEAFASRDKFKKIEPWLQKLFYDGGAKIISNAMEDEFNV